MPTIRTITFDGWVLRTGLGELTRNGRKVRLQDQPLQILEELLVSPGELVTRERLIARLWPTGVVDFDTGLNSAIRKLRLALNDTADTPRYIETIPRKGYRFIGTIDSREMGRPSESNVSIPVAPTPSPAHAAAVAVDPAAARPSASRSHFRLYIYVAAVVAAAVTVFAVVRMKESSLTTPAIAPDGQTLAVLPFSPSANSEDNSLFAQAMTRLVRERLAHVHDLTVIEADSIPTLAHLNVHDAASKLHASLLLKGTARRTGDELQVEATLLDGVSGETLWTIGFDRRSEKLPQLLSEICERVLATADISAATRCAPGQSNRAVNLDAYDLYTHGQSLMAALRPAETEAALESFRRATILEPTFARAYLGLGQAQLLLMLLRGQDTPDQRAELEQAWARALELDSSLGEVWIERARLATDPVQAEEMYRKGIALAPNYGTGYLRFADLLFAQYRKGEMVAMIDRASELDPLSPRILVRKGFFVMVARSDIAEHDRLVNAALQIDPEFPAALSALAHSASDYKGQFADAVRISEAMLTAEPQSPDVIESTALYYLDVDDAQAAESVVMGHPVSAYVAVCIAQYRSDTRHAAELAHAAEHWIPAFASPEGSAVRDAAIATGNLSDALEVLESRYARAEPGAGRRMWNSGLALVYAHTLTLAGDMERGRKLASSVLAQIDSEATGRVVEDWFARQRAAAFAILGNYDSALDELAVAVKQRRTSGWWYLERDPVFREVRDRPRFKALMEEARQQRSEQRALVDKMRAEGVIPIRAAR